LTIEAAFGASAYVAKQAVSMAGEGRMFRRATIATAAIAIGLIASFQILASLDTAAATPDLMAQAVVARDTSACQSPWQVIEGRGCHGLPAGTKVNVVSGDDFFACIVWPGTQRCMWVARDALRRP
jgi:hypothetical protein